MTPNLKPSQRVAILAAINPDEAAAGAYSTGWVDVVKFHNFLAVAQVGNIPAATTVDAKVQQASAADGTGTKDVAGAAIAQLGATDDNKQVEINVRQDALDMNGGFRFLRLTVTVGGTGPADISGLVLGFDGREQPASDHDATSVAQIVG
ncbi:MAG TPA: hypothetical protein VM434_15770 [Beijerinckiaceae bacterium]|nr:hypothetical protein [Beijerinckiaceae bacterium]